MPGIRLHPNYHGYKLDDPRFAKLLELAEKQNLLVQIAIRMEDPRTQHRLLTVPDVDPAPLADLLRKFPSCASGYSTCHSVRPDLLDKLLAAGNLSVEIAMLEGIAGITNLLKHVPLERVCLGTYAPFFALQSALGKLPESALGEKQRAAIATGNAKQLLSNSLQ
jgi:predicted TIM-barrel fold metal-dependent hydrolase